MGAAMPSTQQIRVMANPMDVRSRDPRTREPRWLFVAEASVRISAKSQYGPYQDTADDHQRPLAGCVPRSGGGASSPPEASADRFDRSSASLPNFSTDTRSAVRSIIRLH